MRLPLWAGPVLGALACAGALALALWALYRCAVWFAAAVAHALIGLFVIGYGLDPGVMLLATPGMASTP